ncbi:MAG: iron-containing alcohol dehydrogenase [Candidatus Gastranaerophilales bacterium]|nr:iron-containing alcohol dehydrogenase [Candidatus Gastranaerophilales bacterium]
MWENDIDINEIKEIRVKTNVYFGIGAINKIDDILKNLKEKNVEKVIVVSGRNAYKSTGAWDVIKKALEENNVGYVNYDKVTPNPTVDHIDEATQMAKDFGATAVIGIGGGSPIDTAKSVAVLLKYPNHNARDLYTFKFTPQVAVPIVAINLTHGTGSEANRFAVATVPETEFKPALAYDCLYPYASIDDPKLMQGLSPKQTLFVSIDAINHAVEAATSKVASPLAISLAYETIKTVVKYLPKIIKNPSDLEARYFLTYAAMLGGVSFDNGLLHLTHALEHPLSGMKPQLTHGLGLAILLPSVIKYAYSGKPHIFAYILSPIVEGLKGEASEAQNVANAVEKWLFEMGATQKLADEGFSEADIDKIVDLTFNTPSLDLLLSIAPIEATKEVVDSIFRESLQGYNRKV